MKQFSQSVHLSADLLELLPADVRSCLNGLCLSLSRLIGQIKTAPLTGNEELEGFSGITRKVNYQRLLISEWGLLQHLPAEFQRRAAMGEHLFLDQQRTAIHKAGKILLLFNAGPEQLGSARVIHLALWLLMLRRSEAAKAELHWGILQEGPATLSTRTDQYVLINLLKGRNASYFSSTHWQQWQESLNCDQWSECWMIGVDGDDLVLPKISQIKIREPWTTLVDHLDIEVLHQKHVRSLSLQLPNSKLLLRLLRNPLEEQKVVELQPSDDAFIFLGTGAHGWRAVYKQVKNNRLKIVPLPNAANGKAGKNRFFSWDAGQELVAVDTTKKRISAITQDKDHWYLHQFPNLPSLKILPKNQRIVLDDKSDSFRQFQFRTAKNGKQSIQLLDAKNQMRELHWQENSPLWKTKQTDVIVHSQAGNVSYVIRWDQAKSTVVVEWDLNNSQLQSQCFKTQINRMPKVFAHASGTWNSKKSGVVAVEYALDQWQLHDGKDVIDLSVDSCFEILGVICYGDEYESGSCHFPFGPKLVLLNHLRNQVLIKFEQNERLVYSADVSIIKAYLCHIQLNLHMITETHEHRIYSFSRDEIIYRYSVGANL